MIDDDGPAEVKVKPGELGCAWAAVGCASTVWVGLAIFGLALWVSTAARVPGSPYLGGQFWFYVGVPLVAALIAASLALALRRRQHLSVPAAMIAIVLIFAALGYLFPYVGGV